jgi:hypothetical protein
MVGINCAPGRFIMTMRQKIEVDFLVRIEAGELEMVLLLRSKIQIK